MAGTKKDNFITLKEAAEISGYSSDYLGQLMRSGKLEGQQVFMNAAWMTTREAVEGYIKKSKSKNVQIPQGVKNKVKEFLKQNWKSLYQIFLYTLISLNIVFLLFLVHLTSFSIEKHFEKRDFERQQSTYLESKDS